MRDFGVSQPWIWSLDSCGLRSTTDWQACRSCWRPGIGYDDGQCSDPGTAVGRMRNSATVLTWYEVFQTCRCDLKKPPQTGKPMQCKIQRIWFKTSYVWRRIDWYISMKLTTDVTFVATNLRQCTRRHIRENVDLQSWTEKVHVFRGCCMSLYPTIRYTEWTINYRACSPYYLLKPFEELSFYLAAGPCPSRVVNYLLLMIPSHYREQTGFWKRAATFN
jgi:hypothetical protein